MPFAFGAAIVTAFGLIIGSFLNVVIHRLPRKQSVVWPASRCTRCGRDIRWYDNVPVVSWIVLRGRCRDCGEPIAVRYPIVEAVTATLFFLQYLVVGPDPLLAPRLLFTAAMVALFAIDLEHMILPNVITLPGAVIGFLCALVLPPGWAASLLGIVVGAGTLLGVAMMYERLRHEEGLGMGDVKMLAMVGAFLGWQLVLLTLVLSSLLGALVGVGVLAVRRGGLKYALPYGTFIAIAAVVASFVGDQVVAWYVSFYR